MLPALPPDNDDRPAADDRPDGRNEPVDVLKWNGYAIQAGMLARSIEVTSDESARTAIDSLKRIKEFYREAEEARKAKGAPFYDMVKRINNTFKPITQTLEEAEAILKEKILAWQTKQEELRREFERKQLEEYDEALRDPGRAERAPFPVLTLPADTTVAGETGSASQRTLWRWKVVDLARVPPEYLMLNEKLINEQVRKGVRRIAGLEIYPEKTLAVK